MRRCVPKVARADAGREAVLDAAQANKVKKSPGLGHSLVDGATSAGEIAPRDGKHGCMQGGVALCRRSKHCRTDEANTI